MIGRVNLRRRPGQAKRRYGTHTPQRSFCEDAELPTSRNNGSLGLWVPAFAGTMAELCC
jgi:hypothetical protein